MTALSVERVHGHRGSAAIPPLRSYLVLEDEVLLCGGMVALNAAGLAVEPVSTDPTLRVVGVSRKTADATDLATVRVEVEAGVFRFDNSAGDDAITIADINRPCYLVDNQTLARTDGVTRPYAGMVFDVTSEGVFVLCGVVPEPGVEDVPLEAAADLAALGNTFVALDSAGKMAAASAAGQDCYGVLLAGTASGAVGIVRRRGRCKVVASDTIAIGVRLGTTNAGKSKDAVNGNVDTDGNAQANLALLGSYVLGIARSAGAADTLHTIDVQPLGLIPTTAE